MVPYEKFRTSNFSHDFWLEYFWNLTMADFVLQMGCAHTCFLWKFLILSHFLNLKTPTENSRLRHERAFFITLGTIEKLASINNIKKWLELQNLQKEKQNRKDSMCWEKRLILFFFSRDDERSWREFFSV